MSKNIINDLIAYCEGDYSDRMTASFFVNYKSKYSQPMQDALIEAAKQISILSTIKKSINHEIHNN
jgi:hypothetical protein